MEYSDLFLRSWRLVWRNKFMLALGILIAALTGQGVDTFLPGLILEDRLEVLPQLPIPPQITEFLSTSSPKAVLRQVFATALDYGIAGLIAAALLILFILILVGVVVIVARGAIIFASAEFDANRPISLSPALHAGWRKAWTLILIATIPPIPITIAAIIAVLIATAILASAGGAEFLNAPAEVQQRTAATITLLSITVACPFAVMTTVLSLLSHLAERACVLENTRAIASFRRAWHVIRANAGSALILAVFQLGIEVAARTVLTPARLVAAFCFLTTPLIWILVGIMRAYFITLWTLAWRRWMIPPISGGITTTTSE